jgi:hypothetical protein
MRGNVGGHDDDRDQHHRHDESAEDEALASHQAFALETRKIYDGAETFDKMSFGASLNSARDGDAAFDRRAQICAVASARSAGRPSPVLVDASTSSETETVIARAMRSVFCRTTAEAFLRPWPLVDQGR